MSVAIEMEAGHPGRHGDSAAQPVARASRCASVPVTTPRPGTAAACVSGQEGMKGEDDHVCQ